MGDGATARGEGRRGRSQSLLFIVRLLPAASRSHVCCMWPPVVRWFLIEQVGTGLKMWRRSPSKTAARHCQDEADFGSIAPVTHGGGGSCSAGAAFEGAGAVVPDPSAMAGQEETGLEDRRSETRPIAASRGRPARVSARVQAGKRVRFRLFNVASALIIAKRTATLAREKAFDAARDAEADLSAILAEITLLPEAQQADNTFAHSRLEFLRAILTSGEGSSQFLANLLAEVEGRRRCPPCDKWLHLATLEAASAIEQEAFEALDRAQTKKEARPTAPAHAPQTQRNCVRMSRRLRSAA